MTPEKLERTIEFIIEHQAQAAVHIEQLAATAELAGVLVSPSVSKFG
jgi:hypothetical protein